MTLSPSQLQKNAIIADLETLVNSGVLKAVLMDDFSKASPLDRDWPGFPSAVVIPPLLSGNEFEDTANNTHEYTWYVNVVTTPESLPKDDPLYLEGLVDSVVALFDMDATLGGTANAAVYPTILDAPGIVSPPNAAQTYVGFAISFKAKCTVPAGVKQK